MVADHVGVERPGGLHRGHAEQLEDVVLDHVAQRAGLLVVAARVPTPSSSATVIWTWSMYFWFQSGSKMLLPNRRTIRFCTVSLPR